MVGAIPADGAILDAPPPYVGLTFSDRVQGLPMSAVQVLLNGQDVTNGLLSVDPYAGQSLSIPLHPGYGDGQYSVSWSVAALDDGTVTSGGLSFTVRTAEPLYRLNGTAAGSVAASALGGTTELSLRLQAVRPNATYMVYDCVSDPFNNPVGVPGFMCLPPVNAGSLTSDGDGGASGLLQYGGVLPLNIVLIVNAADPSDTAEAVLLGTPAGGCAADVLVNPLTGPPAPGVLPSSVYTSPCGGTPNTPVPIPQASP